MKPVLVFLAFALVMSCALASCARKTPQEPRNTYAANENVHLYDDLNKIGNNRTTFGCPGGALPGERFYRTVREANGYAYYYVSLDRPTKCQGWVYPADDKYLVQVP